MPLTLNLTTMSERLDLYSDYPRDMRTYLDNYGWHFNNKALEYALERMHCTNAGTGKSEAHEPMTKEAVKELLKRYSIDIGKVSNDVVYVANYGMAKLYTSSIADETHLAKYIKDVVGDPDCPGGNVFARWYADMRSMGEPVDWDELL